LNGGFGGVVPEKAVAFVGYEKRDAEAGGGWGRVVIPATDGMAAMVEETFVVLAEAVVVLVIG
jgi:hypothetical protein